MQLYKMIEKRRSCRSFTGTPVEDSMLEKVKALEMKPLYPEIKVHWQIVPRDRVKCLCPWTTPQLITIYSERREGYLENVGFMFQQMELYLQSLGLGACWLGMGRLDSQSARNIDGMEFVIMLAFGYPKGNALRKSVGEFKRKALSEISDRVDPRLEPARLAPSGVNSQPWYFTHDGDVIHAYCGHKGILKPALSDMNRIDMGIALAHLYAANADSFRFFKTEKDIQLKGYSYIGSVTL